MEFVHELRMIVDIIFLILSHLGIPLEFELIHILFRSWFNTGFFCVSKQSVCFAEIKQKTPTPATPSPRPTTQPRTTRAPATTAKTIREPGQIAEGKSSPKEDHPKGPTKTDKIRTPSKNSTADKMADASGGLGEAVETHVVVESPTDSHQGPIVALGLGLGITVILLFFVGCRLRNVKRRIRKGRALHSNEADYLINGMYL